MTQVVSQPPPAGAAKLIVQFVSSISDVLRTMAGVSVKFGTPHIKTAPISAHDVSGVIGFSGGFTGAMVLSFDLQTARGIVGAFAKTPIEPASPDFADAVGELANMIAGSAKTSFGRTTSISVPNIIMGSGHVIARLHDVPCVIIPCQTQFGNFAVEVSLKPQPSQNGSGGQP